MTETKVDHLNEARVAMQRYPGGEKATEHDANRAIAHALIALVEEVRGIHVLLEQLSRAGADGTPASFTVDIRS